MIKRPKLKLENILACPLCSTERVVVKTCLGDSLICPMCHPEQIPSNSCNKTEMKP